MIQITSCQAFHPYQEHPLEEQHRDREPAEREHPFVEDMRDSALDFPFYNILLRIILKALLKLIEEKGAYRK